MLPPTTVLDVERLQTVHGLRAESNGLSAMIAWRQKEATRMNKGCRGGVMLAIGNDEIRNLPPLGETIKCWMCGKRHRITYGDKVMKNGTRVPSKLRAFLKCKGKFYLGGIEGKEWKPRGKG